MSLRYANIALNSELSLAEDESKKSATDYMISIQFEDKLRKTGQFKPDDNLWHVIENLFSNDIPEINDDNLLFSINYLNKQVYLMY